MSLFENGTLDIDVVASNFLTADVGNRLPNVNLATVRQLLNHTAGMSDHDDDVALSNYVDDNNGHLPSAEDLLAYLYEDVPRFAPGAAAAYSSAHTLALSLVIDVATGTHHSDTVGSNIISRLNLRESFYKNEEDYPRPKNLVNGYYGYGNSVRDITTFAINYSDDSQ